MRRKMRIPTAETLLCSIDEAACLLGIGRNTMLGMLTAGHCEGVYIAKRHLVVVSSVRKIAESSGQKFPIDKAVTANPASVQLMRSPGGNVAPRVARAPPAEDRPA